MPSESRSTPSTTFAFILLLSITVSLVLWANRPEFVILYSDMDTKNSSKIIADLQGAKIRYQIEDNPDNTADIVAD